MYIVLFNAEFAFFVFYRFPLYPRGERFHFEYGVYLLNKNIAQVIYEHTSSIYKCLQFFYSVGWFWIREDRSAEVCPFEKSSFLNNVRFQMLRTMTASKYILIYSIEYHQRILGIWRNLSVQETRPKLDIGCPWSSSPQTSLQKHSWGKLKISDHSWLCCPITQVKALEKL